ncbi:MAG: lipoyl(octanoyl) transferase LipB [Sphingobium sp.]|nr:lipoyl(octanoyl) transferase LipB [Sphingobium sp.]
MSRPGVSAQPTQVPVTLDGVEWRIDAGLTDYDAALAEMESRAAAIANDGAGERIWLLEHPPLYTAGTSAKACDLIDARFPVHETGRGGQYTYHGPGQRIVYLNVDLGARGRDIRRFVQALEHWTIAALADLGVESWTADGRIGIWTRGPGPGGAEAKIGAIGVRVRKWVTMHGLSINVAPDLSHYGGIVPCGIGDLGVTSLAALDKNNDMAALDAALLAHAPAMLRAIGA